MMKHARIFDIQSFSVHDGPGCRTNIFFSGCPLRCRWCANPEGWRMSEQLLFSEHRCTWENGCNSCRDSCERRAIDTEPSNKPVIHTELCRTCNSFDCVKACTQKALRRCSREYSLEEILRILERDSNNWGPDGGVTFTGGEALMQYEFLDELIDRCREAYIHTAIETSGYAQESIFMDVMTKLDFAFIDIKHMDPAMHMAGTGVSNELILSNIKKLAGSEHHGRIIIRQPVIYGYNSSLENAAKMQEFLNDAGLFELNLLKFHRMGQTKWEQLGMTYPFADNEDVSEEIRIELQNYYLDHGIACYLDDEIIY